MPIEIGIWRLAGKLEKMAMSSLAVEKQLEDHIVADPSILSPGLLIVGRQVPTAYGKFIDLLAIDADGKLHVVELKRDRTPREVVAQLLDYGSWVRRLTYEDVAAIYKEKHPGQSLEVAFAESFGSNPPETINQSHELIVVSSQLDPSTERIISYLVEEYSVPINAVFFRCFKDGEREYLARTWLIDPDEAEAKAEKKASPGQESWNGRDFYVSLGEGVHRNWEDCRLYGFVSGGGGRWYSQTLAKLFPGARVFVNIPGTPGGYVGVGTVKETAVSVEKFQVQVDGSSQPLLSVPLKAPNMSDNLGNLDLCEWIVRVEWIKTVPKASAYWEKGLFASQHTACRLRNRFTIERLSKHFGIED